MLFLLFNNKIVERHEEEENQEGSDNDLPSAGDEKMGAKKRAKLEAKEAKKAARELEEKRREDAKKREVQLEEERKKLEEKQKLEEQKEEEERKRLQEEKERREHEEYLKMKQAFSVEEEGYDEDIDESEMTLQKFIDYVKDNKVIVIEDAAVMFKLKTQAVIDRINDLQKDNVLSGVMDDRGKFIYISQEELQAFAKFIKQRGRVSLTELAEGSNKLINLQPKQVLAS